MDGGVTLRDWCVERALDYRNRSPEVTNGRGEPHGLCRFAHRELGYTEAALVIDRLNALPNISKILAYKWPLDDSGFDLRADWLLKFAEELPT